MTPFHRDSGTGLALPPRCSRESSRLRHPGAAAHPSQPLRCVPSPPTLPLPSFRGAVTAELVKPHRLRPLSLRAALPALGATRGPLGFLTPSHKAVCPHVSLCLMNCWNSSLFTVTSLL